MSALMAVQTVVPGKNSIHPMFSADSDFWRWTGLITVRKMDSGSVIALYQLADRTDFVRIVLAALSVRSLPVGFDLDEDPVSHLRVNDYRFDSGDFHIVRVEPGRK